MPEPCSYFHPLRMHVFNGRIFNALVCVREAPDRDTCRRARTPLAEKPLSPLHWFLLNLIFFLILSSDVWWKNPTCFDRYKLDISCVGGILCLIILFVNKMLMKLDVNNSNARFRDRVVLHCYYLYETFLNVLILMYLTITYNSL